jgi:hypothetical protein
MAIAVLIVNVWSLVCEISGGLAVRCDDGEQVVALVRRAVLKH